ncbi:hypothetical protein [Halomonas lysinitropha]|uniref:hypothetical protein n=1 Tax=Halomonas lysinitropha TaxID=2607506 RepID=UPI001249ED71|nr:hypothetical protein [Halomonas lysinitropha]
MVDHNAPLYLNPSRSADEQVDSGRVFLERGELAQALSCFQHGLAVDSSCIAAYRELGDLLFRTEHLQDARRAFGLGLREAPRHLAWRLQLVRVLLRS